MNLHWPRLKRIRRSSPASSGSWLSLSIHLLQLAWLFRNTDPARFPISQGRTLRTTLRLLLVYQTYPSAHLFDNLVADRFPPPPLLGAMEDNFNTPKAVYGKESFGGWTRRSRSLAAADFTEDGGPHLSSLLARLCRTRPQGSTPLPPTWIKCLSTWHS